MKFFNNVKMDQVINTINSKDAWGRNMLRDLLSTALPEDVVSSMTHGINPSFNKEVAMLLVLNGYIRAWYTSNDDTECDVLLTKIQDALYLKRPTMTPLVFNTILDTVYEDYKGVIVSPNMDYVLRQAIHSTKLSIIRDNKSVIGYKVGYLRFIQYYCYWMSKYLDGVLGDLFKK